MDEKGESRRRVTGEACVSESRQKGSGVHEAAHQTGLSLLHFLPAACLPLTRSPLRQAFRPLFHSDFVYRMCDLTDRTAEKSNGTGKRGRTETEEDTDLTEWQHTPDPHFDR